MVCRWRFNPLAVGSTLTSDAFNKGQSIQAPAQQTVQTKDKPNQRSGGDQPQPTVGLIQFTPSVVTTDDDVIATARAIFDPDPADANILSYTFEWFVDQQPVLTVTATDAVATKLSAEAIRRDQTVRVEITPYDGEEFGPPTTASFVVANTPPEAPGIDIQPKAPVTEEDLTCSVVQPSLMSTATTSNCLRLARTQQRTDCPGQIAAHFNDSRRRNLVLMMPSDGTNAGAVAVATETIRKLDRRDSSGRQSHLYYPPISPRHTMLGP